jgi:mono/diheme cytochrome c family protein
MRPESQTLLKRGAVGLAAILILGLIALAAVYAFTRWHYSATSTDPVAGVPPTEPSRVARGAYLARAGDCIACHTAAGGQPFAGGLALDTGFGKVLSSNITPDMETGIGGWSMRQFILAMREGIGDHGKRLYPAMPYNTYAKVSDNDLIDLKYYLDTLAPVRNEVDSNQMSFPFNIRPLMIGWNLLFLNDAAYVEDPQQSPAWNRGAYLVQGLGHCTTCHSPKNPLGGDQRHGFLQGAILQGWYAPSITGDAWAGVNDWSVEDIARYLKDGANRHAIAVGPMAEAIANSTQYLGMQDLQAIGTYLKSLSGNARTEPAATAEEAVHSGSGQHIYASVCASCHGLEGRGIQGMGPALQGNIVVGRGPANNVLHMILVGGESARTQGVPKGYAMPGFAWKLDNQEVADLATYIRTAWANGGSAVSAEEVDSARTALVH